MIENMHVYLNINFKQNITPTDNIIISLTISKIINPDIIKYYCVNLLNENCDLIEVIELRQFNKKYKDIIHLLNDEKSFDNFITNDIKYSCINKKDFENYGDKFYFKFQIQSVGHYISQKYFSNSKHFSYVASVAGPFVQTYEYVLQYFNQEIKMYVNKRYINEKNIVST
jgi:hypothetical protein